MALKLAEKVVSPGIRWVNFDKDTKIQIDGIDNPDYRIALERVQRRIQRNDAAFAQGEVGVLPGEKTEHESHCALLAQFVIKDWDGVQDASGNPLKFDAEACSKILEVNYDFFLFVLREGSKSAEEISKELAETVEKL